MDSLNQGGKAGNVKKLIDLYESKDAKTGLCGRKVSLTSGSGYYSLTTDQRLSDLDSVSISSFCEEDNETVIKHSDNKNGSSVTYVDLKGSKGANLNVQCGKENIMVTGDEKRRNAIIRATQSVIQTYTKYVIHENDQERYERALTCLETNNVVIIKGKAVGQKKTFGISIFAHMSKHIENKFLIGSVTDFNEIVDINVRQLLFLEEIFGRFKKAPQKFEEWLPQLNWLSEYINKSNSKVIITVTSEVLEEHSDYLDSHTNIFNERNIVDMEYLDSDTEQQPNDDKKTYSTGDAMRTEFITRDRDQSFFIRGG